jgi:TatD DNase family protein
MLVDTHCHLYLKNFDTDLENVISRSIANGVNKIFLPAIDKDTHDRLHALADRNFSKHSADFGIFPMMGVHPCSITANFEDELNTAKNYLDSGRKYYAVGEIGLDYYWDVTYKEQQIIAFERQIDWSIEKKLPVVIHSRNSTSDCIKSVSKYQGKVKGIFHCFSGTLDEAKQIIDLGLYLGIGGVVTYKNSDLKEIIRQTGLGNVVLETDAPYLAPIPFRGKRNEPSYIKPIAQYIADSLDMDVSEVAQATTSNALRVFGMND